MRPKRETLLSDLIDGPLRGLSATAWTARENASIVGSGTKVGSALLTDDGSIFAGCNIEHPFRCHDIHAEVNAIASMVTGGGKAITAILIAAERELFTPCGGCMDWIMRFADENCVVGFQSSRDGFIQHYKATELMPFYPK